jgi:polar amino acid transport system permease protein
MTPKRTPTTTLQRVRHSGPPLGDVEGESEEPILWVTARPVRNIRQRVIVVLVLLALGVAAVGLAQNPHMQWDVVAQYLWDGTVLKGIVTTVELTVISLILATVLAVPLASMQRGTSGVIATLAGLYVWFFRGVPTIIQLLFWYNIALVVPSVGLSVPNLFQFSFETNVLITGFTASILGLGLHESAYMAEIVRAGINSVPKGQTMAATALGMSRRQTLFRVILPQAARTILPPSGNEFIRLLKESSLVAIIGGGGLLTAAQYIYGQNYAVIPLLLVASIWYLVLTTITTFVQRLLESRSEPRARSTKGPGTAQGAKAEQP